MTESHPSDTVAEAAPNIRFNIVFRGYDRHQVNEYLLGLTERARRESEALQDAEQELDLLRDGSTSDGRGAANAVVGTVVDRIVTLAQQEAYALVAAAEQDAATIRATAREQAEAMLAAAHEEADRIRAQAPGTDQSDIEHRLLETLRQHRSVLEGLAEAGALVERVTPLLEGRVPAARQPEAKPAVSSKAETASDD